MRRAALGCAIALLLTALPASAANPVLDPADDADLVASLMQATEAQDVCYGYQLLVSDQDTGQWAGSYAASSLGVNRPADLADPTCSAGVVELLAQIDYASSFSEADDSAAWFLRSTLPALPALTITDVEALGLSARDLLEDGKSAATLLNAVQLLPRLAAERAGLPPVVLEPNTAALPPDARPTGTPGSDWLRENGLLLGLCVLLMLGGGVLFAMSPSRPPPAPWSYHRRGPSAPATAPDP